ncbi:class I SAM-dependent methyltransferase [Sphingoaurantiacus capsulatus]|uniref:Class I SAM-dependent methyltransferase n=1 Tax=Sphingoaurantiacus capsulatus TaxID=1771310 RepID=A0ABV7X8G8_9SPHN
MSSTPFSRSEPGWLGDLFGALPEGGQADLGGRAFVRRNDILRELSLASDQQEQTKSTFGFKWEKRDTFESEASLRRMKEWLIERYGDVPNAGWWKDHGDKPLVVDAGCGAGMSGLELFAPAVPRIRYLGVDISTAVDVARDRFEKAGLDAGFMQADITDLPLPEGSVDVIFSEGVLHHTDSTERALKSLARRLKVGGRFLFYVYKTKGPIREFTDDYIRDKLEPIAPEQAWELMMPLTKLGQALGELNIELTVPEEISLLEIPAGKINLQRLFYWHVFKAFYREDLTLDEMNHINFDWYAPRNAARQTPEQVRQWCREAGLEIEREVVEDAGITIQARRTA